MATSRKAKKAAAKAKPYKIKGEHSEMLSVPPEDKDLNADEYHKIPGGVILPQTREYGGKEYGADEEAIPIVEINMGSEDEPATKKQVGVFQRNSKVKGTSPDNVAPSGLVAPASHPAVSPLSLPADPQAKKELTKVVLDSKVFGKVTIPASEVVQGVGCILVILDSSDGFTFVPPTSETTFRFQAPKVTIVECDKLTGINRILDVEVDAQAFFCGQTFERPSVNEQGLIFILKEE
jgi:hypothetical protein